MQCTFCEAEDTRVLETRHDSAGTVQRKRQCKGCGQRFVTIERIHTEYLTVKKQNGEVERFQREKIIKGIGRASSVFKIPAADVNGFIDRILDRLQPDSPGTPIRSVDIGNLVLRYLQDSSSVTDVARIRFAMVFLGKINRPGGFQDINDLKDWLLENYPTLAELESDQDAPARVIKRNTHEIEPFDLKKLERSIGIAAKGRGSDAKVRHLATEVAAEVYSQLQGQSIVTSQQVAAAVLLLLRQRDDIAYLRYAATNKPFRSVQDFWREVLLLAERAAAVRG